MRVDLVDVRAIPALLRGKQCLHFKGFSAHLRDSPLPSLLATLKAADVIVFDGDDFELDSFTAAIVAVGAGSPGAPVLLAFKRSDDLRRFNTSWSRCPAEGIVYVCPLPPAVCDEPRFWNPTEARAWCASHGDVPASPGSEIRGLAADAGSLKPSQRRYVGLGVAAVELTRASVEGGGSVTVAAWGGGVVPGAEFLLQEALFGGGMPPWQYWHATRTRPGGSPEGGRLHGVAHCKLTEVAT